jgi:ABC-type amino acid transport substrate-binding protein
MLLLERRCAGPAVSSNIVARTSVTLPVEEASACGSPGGSVRSFKDTHTVRLRGIFVVAALVVAAASTPATAKCLRIARWIGTTGFDWLVPPLAETYRRAGECVEWVPIPIGRSWPMLENGEIDGDMVRAEKVIALMKHVVSVPTDIPGFDAVLITRRSLTPPRSLADAANLRLVALLGYRALDLVPGIKELTVTRESDLSVMMQELLASQVDGVFADHNTYRRFMSDGGIDPTALAPPLLVMSVPTHIVLNERQRGKVPAIDRALASVIADGLFLPTAAALGGKPVTTTQ